VLRERHQRDELRRQEKRGGDEEHDGHRESVVAPDGDDQALRQRRGGGEREEHEPIVSADVWACEGGERRCGRSRDGCYEKRTCGRSKAFGARVAGACLAPDMPQSDSVVTRRIGLRVGVRTAFIVPQPKTEVIARFA